MSCHGYSTTSPTLLSLLSQRERYGTSSPQRNPPVVSSYYSTPSSYRPSFRASAAATVVPHRTVPSHLASRAAWNAKRMNNMILAVGPGTPACRVFGPSVGGTGVGGGLDDDEDDDDEEEEDHHPLLLSSDEDDDDDDDDGGDQRVSDDGDSHESREGEDSSEEEEEDSGSRGGGGHQDEDEALSSAGGTSEPGNRHGDEDAPTSSRQTTSSPNQRLHGDMPPPKPSMRHGGCINTASWLTASWRLSLDPRSGGGSSSHNANAGSVVSEFQPRAVRSRECPTQLVTSGDDRTVKFWDVSGAMGSSAPHPDCPATAIPFASFPSPSYSDDPLELHRDHDLDFPARPRPQWRKKTFYAKGGKELHGTVQHLATVTTGHRGNVFHVTPVPCQPGKVATCAADGFLNLSDVEHNLRPANGSGGGGSSQPSTVVVSPEFGEAGEGIFGLPLFLAQSGMCFSHTFLTPHTGLVCSERGLHRFDTRVSPSAQPTRSVLRPDGDASAAGPGDRRGGGRRSISCKACAVWRPHMGCSPHDASSLFDDEESQEGDGDGLFFDASTYVFAGGQSGDVSLYDLRMDGHRSRRIMRTYRPSTIDSDTVDSVSVSGLDITRDGRELLVSYENEQIYTFPIIPPSSASTDERALRDASAWTETHPHLRNGLVDRGEEASSDEGPETGNFISESASFGGHLNRYTFLKGARYAGTRDEYICTGSDSGNAWIYERRTGAVVSLLMTDKSTCNGVIPHPSLPIFVTYGIDSTAKLWRATGPVCESADDSFEGRAQRELGTEETVLNCTPYRKSALVRRWEGVQNKLAKVGTVGRDGDSLTGLAVLPDVVPMFGGDEGSFSGGSHVFQFPRRHRAWGDRMGSNVPQTSTIVNNLRSLPTRLQQNFFTCVLKWAGDEEPVKSLEALGRRVSVARLRHQADRLGLEQRSEIPWFFNFRPCHSVVGAAKGGGACSTNEAGNDEEKLSNCIRNHPSELVPDCPSDWVPYDKEMTWDPLDFGLRVHNDLYHSIDVEVDADEEEGRPCVLGSDESYGAKRFSPEGGKVWVVRSRKEVEGGKHQSDGESSRRTSDEDNTSMEPETSQSQGDGEQAAVVRVNRRHFEFTEKSAWDVLTETVHILKDGGNQALQAGLVHLAAKRYDKALRYCSLVFVSIPSVGNLTFLSKTQDALTMNDGRCSEWTPLFKAFLMLRLNLSMAMLKPEIGDHDGAAEQARLAIHDLRPFAKKLPSASGPGNVVGLEKTGDSIIGNESAHPGDDSAEGTSEEGNEEYSDIVQDATDLLAKAYFRLGSALNASRDFAAAVRNFEKSAQCTKLARAGGKPDALVLRRLAEARRDHQRKKERQRKKLKKMFDEDGRISSTTGTAHARGSNEAGDCKHDGDASPN